MQCSAYSSSAVAAVTELGLFVCSPVKGRPGRAYHKRVMEGATHFSVNFLTIALVSATYLEAASCACLQIGIAGCL